MMEEEEEDIQIEQHYLSSDERIELKIDKAMKL